MSFNQSFSPLRTKLFLPVVRKDYLLRERLYDRLEEGRLSPLILVSAPAGFGKTTLLSAWLRQLDEPVIWLTLDELDNDLVRFIAYLVAGADDVEPGRMPATTALLAEERTLSIEEWVITLIEDYLAWPAIVHLALDDVHLIHDPLVLNFLKRLVERLPPNLRLIIASRTDPLLPLNKMRVAHEVVELRAEVLRFSVDEARTYLADALGAPPSTEAIEEIIQQMEGWIAGLRLLVLAVQGQPNQEAVQMQVVNQARHFALRYLVGEVLARQPDQVRDFLLISSLFERFCAALVSELTQQPLGACRNILTLLVQSDLFLVQLDPQREWFRYHQLFQAALQSEFARENAAQDVTTLHLRASAWFAERGLMSEAIHHALAAQELDQAVALVEANSRNYLNGIERRNLENWLAALPADAVWNRPKLLIAKAWLFYRHWRVDELSLLLEKLRELAADAAGGADFHEELQEGDLDPARGHILTLQSVLHLLHSASCNQIIETGRLAFDALPGSERGARAIALISRSIGLFLAGKPDQAFEALEVALADPAPSSPADIQLYLGLCVLCEFAGNFARMEQTAHRFRAAAGTERAFTAAANWMSGRAFYEANQLDEAFHAFSVTAAYADTTNYLAAASSKLKIVQIHVARAELDAAQAVIDQAWAEGIRLRNRVMQPLIEIAQFVVWFETGERERAIQRAQSIRPSIYRVGEALLDNVLLSWARLCLLLGDETLMGKAYQHLQRGLEVVETVYLPYRRFLYRLLLAAFDVAFGEQAAAQAALSSLLPIIKSGGLVRSVLDYGIGLAPYLLEHDLPQPLARLLMETEQSHALLSSSRSSPTSSESTLARESRQGTVDLTHREEEVLRLMQSGYTNQEISNELVISLYTVKRHATNIYGKLNVANRRQAVRTAVAIGILHSTQ